MEIGELSRIGFLAYLDPSTIGMVLQVLLSIVAAVVVGVKLFWRRIAGLFGTSKDDTDRS